MSFRKKYWNQIYHRDIKPGNIFLRIDTQKGEIIAKLADFGCSVSGQWTKLHKVLEQASNASAFTPGYEPPEHPDFSVLTDVWQLALSFASVCTGTRRPRSKAAPNDEWWDKLQPAGPNYTRELNDVMRWCLNEDKHKRPDSLTVLKRLKETYSRLESRLPPIDRPTNVYWQPAIARQTQQAPPPLSSPGPRAGGVPGEIPSRRPGPPIHAFSDQGAERMVQIQNQYQTFGPGQRTPMSPNSIDQIVQGGGGYQPGLPGGFSPMSSPRGVLPGYERSSYFGSRSGRHNARQEIDKTRKKCGSVLEWQVWSKSTSTSTIVPTP